MRAQLGILAACVALALPLQAAGQNLSPEKARLADRFATAVQKAYVIERERKAPVLADLSPDKVTGMQEAVLRVKAMVGGTADFTTLARGRKVRLVDANVFTAESPLERDTQFLKAFYQVMEANIEGLEDPEARSVRDAVQAFRNEQLTVGHVLALERLHAFEIKYGPGSAQLNFVETLENFCLQRVWFFAPGKDGPSPWEMVSSYSTTYLTTVEGEAQAVSVVEVGVRHYNFGYDLDTKGGLRSYLIPRYWSAAFALGDGEDGALRMPFRREPRLGGMASWGDLKVAYLHGEGERWRLLVSRQFHLLPHLL